MKAPSTLLALLALQVVIYGRGRLLLEVDVFRGIRDAAPASREHSRPETRLVAPWASGWSDDPEVQRNRIRNAVGLDRASLVLTEPMGLHDANGVVEKNGTVRGSDYWLAVRYVRIGKTDADLEVRLVRNDEIADGGSGISTPVSVRAELGRTFVVTADDRKERNPVFASLTLRDAPRVSFIGYERPSLVAQVAPVFPELVKRRPLQGTVVIKALVDTDGSVIEPFVLESVEPSLDAAVLDAVRKWRYRPARSRGSPVPVQVCVSHRVLPTR